MTYDIWVIYYYMYIILCIYDVYYVSYVAENGREDFGVVKL